MPTKLSKLSAVIGCLFPIIGSGLFVYFLINQSILTAFLYIILSFLAMIILMAFAATVEEKRKEKQKKLVSTFQPAKNHFQETQSFISFDLLSKMTLDEKNERIYLWAPEDKDIQLLTNVSYGMPYQLFTYSYSDILAIELFEDSTLISTIFRRSKSAKFLLDGLQTIQNKGLGEQSDKNIHTIELKIIMNDRVKPIHIIRFYADLTKHLQKGSAEYQKVHNDSQYWVTVLNLIMKEADIREGVHYNAEDELSKPNTLSPKITKLEVLDAEEYEQKMIANAQLLSVLNQVISIKLNDMETSQPFVNSASYFNKLLEKNKEQLHGDSNQE